MTRVTAVEKFNLTPDSPAHLVRRAWVYELETTDKKQGTGCLAPNKEKRCCLGILSDMAVEAGVLSEYNGFNNWPDIEVTLWAGLTNEKGILKTNEPGGNLGAKNDIGWSFARIAKAIKTNKVKIISAKELKKRKSKS